ncbi:uncharacterized protein L969DRAFT_91023 [Mixia osmundae IAM 14324]|uniref:PUM-HD domain-containing protein n=1 Tax=Mixia osmundae (strain CBS 9802 / IAM 14324 / JCM 22182 / KY 12970) TaxID=764103 RepID=G7DUN2_MIXOS|nr:uncharacterized protein L969DRAFT_91023 [Mixia osmundae IAM 14324]KEI36376.1 hypothetical protein L969DRAFT_91023 [Mixia osmundae IAM 14324]GAA94292.1 hypothetical protein E5Q_00941 [Mixia osmundae IAM 14324]
MQQLTNGLGGARRSPIDHREAVLPAHDVGVAEPDDPVVRVARHGMPLSPPGSIPSSSVVGRPRAGTLPSSFFSAGSGFLELPPSHSRGRSPVGLRVDDASSSRDPSRSPSVAQQTLNALRSDLVRPSSSVDLTSMVITRDRSGSVGKPTIGAVFGDGLFSGRWTPQTQPSPLVPRSRQESSEDPMPLNSALEPEPTHVHTLDYLGLNDAPSQPANPSPAEDAILAQAAQDLSQEILAAARQNRLRAQTMSAAAALRAIEDDLRQTRINGTSPELARQHRTAVSADFVNSRETSPVEERHRLPSPASLLPALREQVMVAEARTGNGLAEPRLLPTSVISRPRAATMLPDGPVQQQAITRPRAGTASALSPEGKRRMMQAQAMAAQEYNLSSSEASLSPTEPVSGYADEDYLQSAPEQTSFYESDRPTYDSQDRISSGHSPSPQPGRTLWLGSLPSSVSSGELTRILSNYGALESVRVLPHKQCAFCSLSTAEEAERARLALNQSEIFGRDHGPIKVGYAKNPTAMRPSRSQYEHLEVGPPAMIHRVPSLYASDSYGLPLVAIDMNAMPLGQTFSDRPIQQTRLSPSIVPSRLSPAPNSSHAQQPARTDIVSSEELHRIAVGLAESPTELSLLEVQPSKASYYPSITANMLAELQQSSRRAQMDATTLREIRRYLEAPEATGEDADETAHKLMLDAVSIASDYIGNTVTQKLFELCSLPVRLMMLERIAPHLAIIGSHKNGTWAAQKIIACATTPDERTVICRHMAAWIPALLLDQFGNYVVQGIVKFGAPANGIVFDAMYDRCWQIAQGRFGARGMRTCLESSMNTRLQQKRVALAIITNAVPLAMNANGTLLLTWLLDSSSLSQRYALLAQQLVPHLSQLCTHKTAASTLTRILSQRLDLTALQIVVTGFLQLSPAALDQVLSDQVHGAAVVQKILSQGLAEDYQRNAAVAAVRESMQRLGISDLPGYARLASEVGLQSAQTPRQPTVRAGKGASGRSSPGRTGSTHVYHAGQSFQPFYTPPPEAYNHLEGAAYHHHRHAAPDHLYRHT